MDMLGNLVLGLYGSSSAQGLLKQTFFLVVTVKVYKKEMAEVMGHFCLYFLVVHE